MYNSINIVGTSISRLPGVRYGNAILILTTIGRMLFPLFILVNLDLVFLEERYIILIELYIQSVYIKIINIVGI